MKNCVVFDLDGTLADCSHRLGYVQTKPKNWNAFFAGIPLDIPIESVTSKLELHDTNIIVTARPESTKSDTVKWLNKHGIQYVDIYFRKSGDFRDDAIVKSEILDQLLKDGYNPILVYEDRKKVISMWRARGLEVVDCGTGEDF